MNCYNPDCHINYDQENEYCSNCPHRPSKVLEFVSEHALPWLFLFSALLMAYQGVEWLGSLF